MDDATLSLNAFGRHLKLIVHFDNGYNNFVHNRTIPKNVNKEDWLPPENEWSRAIDSFIKYRTHLIKNYAQQHQPRRLPLKEQLIMDTLKTIAKRKDIIIKPADKNLGLTILTTAQYKLICMAHLSDANTYAVAIAYDPQTTFTALKEILDKHGHLIDYNKPYGQLTDLALSALQLENSENLRTAVFYCLPKMHKTQIINILPKGRPIASSINCPTYYISKYLNNWLQPLRRRIPTVCMSSDEFILQLHNLQIPKGTVIITGDVASLYPSIPTVYGIQCVKQRLESLLEADPTNCGFNQQDIPFICDLLHLILTHNYVQYNGVVYHQLEGTAMGTPSAVWYADFVLSILEIPAATLDGIVLYKRFIDDIIVLAAEDCPVIATFNAQNNNIQIDETTTGATGIFLDIRITIDSTNTDHPTIVTSLYKKPSNKDLYITPHSAHRLSLLRNLVSTELNRYRLRCTDDHDYMQQRQSLYRKLFLRGYSHQRLAPPFLHQPNREQLLAQLRDRLNNNSNNNNNNNNDAQPHPLVIVTKSPDPRFKIPWKRLLAFPLHLATTPLFKRLIIPRPIIIGNKHYNSAAYYFSKHRDLIPKPNDKATTAAAVTAAKKRKIPATAAAAAAAAAKRQKTTSKRRRATTAPTAPHKRARNA